MKKNDIDIGRDPLQHLRYGRLNYCPFDRYNYIFDEKKN